MDTAIVPPSAHQPAGSQPSFAIFDIDTPSSLRGCPCDGIDGRWVTTGAICSLLFLAAYLIAFPSASLFLYTYSSSPMQCPSPPGRPRFAYLVSGSAGEAGRLRRCLLAIYHPRNHYILHLDAEAPDSDRAELAAIVAAHPVLAAAGNVRVMEKANPVTYRGITMVTTTLHAAATFLHGPHADWDWFINLSASDYPLVTQDDLMDVFSRLPRDLNFIDHPSEIRWKASARATQVIVDPGLYMKTKHGLQWMNDTEKRELPTAFTLFTGAFVEYLIWGWDNLPRTLLVYYANFVSSQEGYFHTVACNADEFRNTIVNHDMHYISWGDPPGHHPELINSANWDKMLDSGAPFGCKFGQDDPMLDRIDADLLWRQPGMLAPGSWCAGNVGGDGSCWILRDAAPLRPGPGAARLQRLVTSLLSEENFRPRQCNIVDRND